MSNAYDLKYQDRKFKRRDLIERLIKEGLNHKMDSGGFQLMKQEISGKRKNELNPRIVYDTQRISSCDIGVILDVPLGTSANINQNYKKINKTIQNFEKLLKIYDNVSDSFSILPVVHGHNSKMIDFAILRIEDVLGETPKALGIGSLVPMVKSIKNSGNTGSKRNFVKILMYLREKLPNSFLHAFGIGGTMAYLAFLCGIDSIDSNGWILKASRGVIQLPGISDRFLRKKSHNRPYLMMNRKIRGTNKTLNEIDMFMKCPCSVCKEYSHNGSWVKKDWLKKRDDFDQYTEGSRLKRAVHNLSLYQNELELIREQIKKKNLLNFIKGRLENSIYKNLFEEVKYKIDLDQKSLLLFN